MSNYIAAPGSLHFSIAKLSISIAMLNSTASPIQRLFQVFFCTKSVIVEITYLTFSQGIPLLCQNQSICFIISYSFNICKKSPVRHDCRD